METEEIKYERESGGTKFQIIAKNGNRPYPFDKDKKDRLYFLRLVQGGKYMEFPYSHDNQIELLKLVINNVLLPHIKYRDIAKFKDALEELEKEEK